MLQYCRDAGIRRDDRRVTATVAHPGRYGGNGRAFALPGERPARGARAGDTWRPARGRIHRRPIPGVGTRAGGSERELFPARRPRGDDAAADALVGESGRRNRYARVSGCVRGVGGTPGSRYRSERRSRVRRIRNPRARVAMGRLQGRGFARQGAADARQRSRPRRFHRVSRQDSHVLRPLDIQAGGGSSPRCGRRDPHSHNRERDVSVGSRAWVVVHTLPASPSRGG